MGSKMAMSVSDCKVNLLIALVVHANEPGAQGRTEATHSGKAIAPQPDGHWTISVIDSISKVDFIVMDSKILNGCTVFKMTCKAHEFADEIRSSEHLVDIPH